MEAADQGPETNRQLLRLKLHLTSAWGSTTGDCSPATLKEVHAELREALTLVGQLTESQYLRESLRLADAKKTQAIREAAAQSARTPSRSRFVAGYLIAFAVSIGGFLGLARYEPGFMLATLLLLGAIAAVVVQVVSYPDRDWSSMEWVGDVIPSAAITFFGVLFALILLSWAGGW